MMISRPSGTVTFLFTDIENSTQLAREHPETWEAAQARHNTILREAIELNNGYVFQIIGDAFYAAFFKAVDALKAAVKAQQDLQNEPWREVTIYVRMGIHTGEADAAGDEYKGYATLDFVQRLMSAGHGGQTLVSSTAKNLLLDQLPPQISLRDMGMQKFAGVPSPAHIFQVISPDLPTEFPPLSTPDNLPNNLPTQLTSFVGREKELADVKRLLPSTHLLTLIGPGGTGKTRLLIQAASEMLHQYPDGVWFVELAPILDPLLVPRTTAIAIGLRDEPQRPVTDMLCDYLRDKKILLGLDNCEHLVDACAWMADQILRAAPNTRILASSREALGIGGEVTYRVPSLGLPDVSHLPSVESLGQYEAVRLFIDRATAAVPNFTVTNHNAPALAQVCHRLDGIPLAIELAAAKVRVLSLEQIAQRLDDRFRLLTGGKRTALERHQTLRAAIDWSYNLLPPGEQVLFRRLSVFVGSWTLEAAELVGGSGSVEREDVLGLMEQLINKSLVITQEAGRESRYTMLETLRQYANEKLVESGESDALRDRHLEHFLNLAETAEPHLIRPEQLEWLPLLEADYENLRLAFEWGLSKESAESSLRLCRALCWFWEIHCYWLEGFNWLTRALAKPSRNEIRSEKVARERALYTRALLEWQLGNHFEQILSPAQASLALANEVSEKRDIAIARQYVGVALALSGENDDQALLLLEQSFAEFQELNEPFWQAQTYVLLSYILRKQANLRFGDSMLMHVELGRKAGERSNLAVALEGYANWLFRTGRVEEAREYAEETDRIYKQLAPKNSGADYSLFAEIAWVNGNYEKASSLYLEMEENSRLLGNKYFRAQCLANLGMLAMDEGNLNQAQVYLEQALALERDAGFKPNIAFRLAELSHIFYLQGNLEEFKQNLRESVALKNYLADYRKTYILMTILGSLYYQKPESSARLLGTIVRFENELDFPLSPVERRYWDRVETHIRNALGDAVFEFTFAEGQKILLDEAFDLAWKTVEELTYIKLPPPIGSTRPAPPPSQRESDKPRHGGLTTREREVAAQIAQGKSNQAIAAELFVGLKTVEAHVTRILSKLGFTSRAQIAGWAVAKGLADAPRDLDTLGKES